MSISQQLGDQKEVTLAQGTIRYRERGNGDPIVFVHGAFVNGDLWREVVPSLAKDFRCIAPDLPLGAHEPAMKPEADLSPPGLARLIADFIEALGLERVTLVGNDTGGALCQLVIANHPGRIDRLVLTPCDAYDNFLPTFFSYLTLTARIPGGVSMLYQTMRIRALRRSPIAFGWLTKTGLPREISDSYIRPGLSSRDVRRDVAKVLKGVDSRYTLEAAKKFPSFERPVLIAWAPEKDFFKWEHAERMAKEFPNARLERIEDSYTFVPEDQPQRLAELIGAFAREPAREPVA
jgi:pimeloyl-ACP methyl ester carboxylesterase